jgi:hypothetical protein
MKEKEFHGQSKINGKPSPTYLSWVSMRQRCYNKNHCAYKNYGGRGIMVCDEWNNNFGNFFSDMGERPEGKSLDRIDNDGNYNKENCKWSTQKEQSNNTRSNTYVTINGETKRLSKWSNLFGINRATINARIKKGFKKDMIFKKGRILKSDLNKIDEKILTGNLREDIIKLRETGCSLQQIGDYYGFTRQRAEQIFKNENTGRYRIHAKVKIKDEVIKNIIEASILGKVSTNLVLNEVRKLI